MKPKSLPRTTLIISALLLAGLLTLACRPTPETLPPTGGGTIAAPAAVAHTLAAPPEQASTLRFEHITIEDGLSQNTVLTILQDQQGFMWFGTEDGLNKYDGYTFTEYKHDPDDTTTLSDNFVTSIYQDRSGDLWVGTRNGLNRLERETDTFVRYQHNPEDPQSLGGIWVVVIYQDREETLWIGTEGGGLDRMDRANDTFSHYRHDPDDPQTLAHNTVRAILQDSRGELWVGTHGGLERLDRASGTLNHYPHDANDPSSLSHNQVSAILEDRDGILWIGTEGGGLDRMDRANGTFSHYQHDPDDPYSLSHDRVRAILQDRAGRLWVGTQNGLDQQVPPAISAEGETLYPNRFIHYQHNPYDPHSLSSSAIWSIYEDRTGVLWFGTYGGGLNKYNRSSDQFRLYQHRPNIPNSLSDNMVWALHADRQGNIWVGTFNGGLNKLDRHSDAFTVYRHNPENPDSLSSDDVRSVLQDHSGTLWVGTSAGLDQFVPETETFVHYRHNPDDPTSLSENRVIVVHEDQRGNLWVGTRNGGLNRLDRATGTFVRYQHDPADPASLSENRVWALYGDRSGGLWVGTLGGVSFWDPDSDRFTRYLHNSDDPNSLSNNAVFSFYQDRDGIVWIGTWGGGLDRFDPTSQTFSHYTEKDGLPNDVIYGIEADSQGHLWLSTNRGISRFDPRSETFRNYDRSDGLQDNEFNAGAHFRNIRGELFFGGIQGFNAFYPEHVQENPYAPPVVITAFKKFNQTVRTDLSSGEHIQLDYRDNLISFEFAALDYTAPGKNQYVYMLEGQDQDWVQAGTRRHVDYTNLKGGDYVFRVKGSNSDGVWNEEGLTMYITVTPPLWETWWFRGIALLGLVGSAAMAYWRRVRQVEARSQELEIQVRERTSEIERRTQELESLYQADEKLYRHLGLDQVLQALVDIAVDILQADKSSLLVWDEQREKLVVRVAHGFGPETIAQMQFERGEGTVGHVFLTGEPVTVEDTWQDERVVTRIVDLEGIRSFMHVPIEIGGQVFGVFNADYAQPRAFGDDELRLFLALAQRAALVIENAQLYEQAQHTAAMEERQRLARDLHDAVTQTLFAASLIAEVLPRLWERSPDVGRQRLQELRELTRGALAEMRTLLLELRPAALLDTGLDDLLRQLAESTTGRARLPVAIKIEGECAPPPEVKVALYRIAQEALNNVAKHAGADQAQIRLGCQPGRIELHIHDNGCGFNPSSVPPDHLGLGIMRERAEAVEVTLTIQSEIGHGTTIIATWAQECQGGEND